MKLLRLFFLLSIIQVYSQDYLNGVILMRVKDEYKYFVNAKGKFTHPLWDTSKHKYFITESKQIFPKAEDVSLEEAKEGKVDLKRWFYIYFDSTKTDVLTLCSNLRKYDFVDVAEPWYIYKPFYTPNDSMISQYLSVVKADLAWDIEKGDSTIIVGIIDTGTEFQHEDLIDNVYINFADPINGIDDDNDGFTDNYYGWDLGGCCFGSLTGDNDPSPLTGNYHGTKVAGMACATTDNNKGVASVGFKTSFLPVKVVPDNAPNAIIWGYQGIVYAANKGARVINCSWGGYGRSLFGQDVVNYATFNRNALVVAAAGNSFEERKYYPAAYDNVLNVAITRNDDIFANTTYGYHIDVCSPGAGMTTDINNQYSSTYGYYTSFASPVVSGAAAIVAAKFPNYTALQIGEQLRATADDIYALNQGFVGKLGKGRINLYKALTISTPSVRISEKQFSKNLLQQGDTVNLFLTLKNFLAPTGNLTVKLYSTNTSAVQVIQNTQTYGSIPTLSSKKNTSPFILSISPNVPNDSEVWIKVEYIDGLYTDFEYFSIVINPTYVNLGRDSLITTINSVSKWGFNDYPYNKQGVGFSFNGKNYLFEGGFFLARKGKVADNIRNASQGNADNDFQIITTIEKDAIGNYEKATNSFNDTVSGLQLEVKPNYYVFDNYPLAIFEYTIKNNSFQIIDSVYVGLFADWDLGVSSNDNGGTLPNKKLAYIYDNNESNIYFGMKLLEGSDSLLVHYTSSAAVFSDSGKWTAIQNPSYTLNDTDIVVYTYTKPVLIPPKDSVKIVFGIFTKPTLTELSGFADSVYNIYQCTQTPPLSVDLGGDTTVCERIILSALTPGASSYLWNTGETTPNITVSQSGTYSVKVYNSYGCEYKDQVNVVIIPPVNVNYSIVPKTGFDGDTIGFYNNSNSTEAIWDFGDGYGSIKDTAFHTYQTPGKYNISLYLANSHCDTTVYDTVLIKAPTNIIKQINSAKIYPNPTTGMLNIIGEKKIKAIKLYSIEGKLLSEYIIKKKKAKLNLEKLNTGKYIIKIVYLNGLTENILIIKNGE